MLAISGTGTVARSAHRRTRSLYPASRSSRGSVGAVVHSERKRRARLRVAQDRGSEGQERQAGAGELVLLVALETAEERHAVGLAEGLNLRGDARGERGERRVGRHRCRERLGEVELPEGVGVGAGTYLPDQAL